MQVRGSLKHNYLPDFITVLPTSERYVNRPGLPLHVTSKMNPAQPLVSSLILPAGLLHAKQETPAMVANSPVTTYAEAVQP